VQGIRGIEVGLARHGRVESSTRRHKMQRPVLPYYEMSLSSARRRVQMLVRQPDLR